MESASEQRVFDIILLLILHSCGYKKPVESLFRSKISSGHLTEVLLESAFRSHGDVSYFAIVIWRHRDKIKDEMSIDVKHIS